MTYKYHCAKCEYADWLTSRVIDRDNMICPNCNAPMKRVFTPTSNIVVPESFSREPMSNDIIPQGPGWSPAPTRREI